MISKYGYVELIPVGFEVAFTHSNSSVTGLFPSLWRSSFGSVTSWRDGRYAVKVLFEPVPICVPDRMSFPLYVLDARKAENQVWSTLSFKPRVSFASASPVMRGTPSPDEPLISS